MGHFFDFLQPIHSLWWTIFGLSLNWLLHAIYSSVQGIPIFATIGAYGVAIIVITLIIRALLAPLLQFQLVTSRRAMVEQRKLAPQVGELRKKYKKDPQRLNAETMKLYQYVFTNFAHTSHAAAHFLFVPNLNVNPGSHPLFSGIPIPSDPVYLIFPLLAALTTYVQSKMMQMPPTPNPTEQELQTMQMQRTMVLISPLLIGAFALNVPAGLGLYWFVGNCVSIIQQSFVVGWGNVLPKRLRAVAGGVPSPAAGKASANGQKAGPPAIQSKSKARNKAQKR